MRKRMSVRALLALLIIVIICCYAADGLASEEQGKAYQRYGARDVQPWAYRAYTGTVFPLTLMESNSTLEVSRHIDYDFTVYQKSREGTQYKDNRVSGVIINDTYQMRNPSNSAVTVTVICPYAGYFNTTNKPTVTLDGNEVIFKDDDDAGFVRYRNEQEQTERGKRPSGDYYKSYGRKDKDYRGRYRSDEPRDRYDESPYHNRIPYLGFEVTIPAGGNVEVNVEHIKGVGFDHYRTKRNNGITGYDLVTTLGSNIAFTKQTVSISNYGGIEIISQNFGFNPDTGITKVTLDQSEMHYFMEISARMMGK